jgi:hypothetical protein
MDGGGTTGNMGIRIQSLVEGPNNYALYTDCDARNYFKGKCGIGWATPTQQLEVGGNTTLRGTLDVTGNITSTGTAHSFAANSIPGSAVDMSTAAMSMPKVMPVRIGAGANYALSAADAGAIVLLSVNSLTVPSDSAAAIPVGSAITISMSNNNAIINVPATGFVIRYGDRIQVSGASRELRAANVYTFYKLASNHWAIQ